VQASEEKVSQTNCVIRIAYRACVRNTDYAIRELSASLVFERSLALIILNQKHEFSNREGTSPPSISSAASAPPSLLPYGLGHRPFHPRERGRGFARRRCQRRSSVA